MDTQPDPPNPPNNSRLRVKTVAVTYGRKINLGDYNSATVEATLWADVPEDVPEDEAMDELWTMAKANVKAQILPLVSTTGALNVEEIFLGLPLTLQERIAAQTPFVAKEN